MAKFNCIGFAAGNTGAQMGGFFRKEIKTVDDLKGLKFRIGGFAGTILQRLGVVPQQLAAGDIYPALEKGTIDAAEWVGPYDDEKLGFVKVAQNYYYPGWWEGCGQGHNLINLAKWNELPKAYQSMIEVASGDAWAWVVGKYDYVNPAALKKLISQGAVLRPFPQPVLEACYNAAQEVYAEHSQEQSDVQEAARQPGGVPQRLVRLAAGGRARLRQLHDAHAHAHLSARPGHTQKARPRSVRSGAFFYLPDDWKGAFALLVIVCVLSSFLDNIAAALIGGVMAREVFRHKVHIGYLAAIVAASNAGGAGSVVGDTTTTMMWIAGVSPLSVVEAYVAVAVAIFIFGIPAAMQQQKYSPIMTDAPAGIRDRLEPRRHRVRDPDRRDPVQRDRQPALPGRCSTSSR